MHTSKKRRKENMFLFLLYPKSSRKITNVQCWLGMFSHSQGDMFWLSLSQNSAIILVLDMQFSSQPFTRMSH